MKVSEIAELLRGNPAGDAEREIHGRGRPRNRRAHRVGIRGEPRARSNRPRLRRRMPAGAGGRVPAGAHHHCRANPKLATDSRRRGIASGFNPSAGGSSHRGRGAGRTTGCRLFGGRERGDRKRSHRGRGNPALPGSLPRRGRACGSALHSCIPASRSTPARKLGTASFSTRAW
jgi:hypothetical protein